MIIIATVSIKVIALCCVGTHFMLAVIIDVIIVFLFHICLCEIVSSFWFGLQKTHLSPIHRYVIKVASRQDRTRKKASKGMIR